MTNSRKRKRIWKHLSREQVLTVRKISVFNITLITFSLLLISIYGLISFHDTRFIV